MVSRFPGLVDFLLPLHTDRRGKLRRLKLRFATSWFVSACLAIASGVRAISVGGKYATQRCGCVDSATLLFGVLRGSGSGQDVSGSLSGTVTDPTGAIIPSAELTLTSEETGVLNSYSAGNDGLYAFSNVPLRRVRSSRDGEGIPGRRAERNHDSRWRDFAAGCDASDRPRHSSRGSASQRLGSGSNAS